MTEEIIIDGVNVAGCPYRKKEVTFMNVIKCYNYGACERVNCLYKQLKRLEQENKELKKLKCKFKEYCTCDTERYCSALEEIKEMTKKYNVEVGDTIIANPIQDCYDIYCKINEALNA